VYCTEAVLTIGPIRKIRVRVNHRDALERRGSKKSWPTIWVSNQLCKIIHLNGGRDEICSRWKIDQSRRCCRAATLAQKISFSNPTSLATHFRPTSTSRRDSVIDSQRVVCDSITDCTESSHITKDAIIVWTIWRDTLVGNVF